MALTLFCVKLLFSLVLPILTVYEVLNSFSLIRNTNSILNTKVGKSDLTYLHGIRVLSLFWVILAHVGATYELPVSE